MSNQTVPDRLSRPSQTLLELHNVELRSDRGAVVFKNVNLSLEPGASAIVAGASGSGKTSLLNLITGRRFAVSGSVEVFGKILKPSRKRMIRSIRRRIGGVGGPSGLVPTLTVAENILLPLVITGERPAVQKERLFRTLGELSLISHANEYPDRLTRVQYTLAQVARATIANQPLVLIDEPAAGLDQATFAQVFEYLFKVSLSGRSLVIVSSEFPPHDLPNSRKYQLVDGVLR
jgi:putative ABC transport system ATP-binding protein